MAITKLNSVNIESSSNSLEVVSAETFANIYPGSTVFLANEPFEVESVNTSERKIELTEVWTGSNITNQPAKVSSIDAQVFSSEMVTQIKSLLAQSTALNDLFIQNYRAINVGVKSSLRNQTPLFDGQTFIVETENQSELFYYDETDTTSLDDGETVLVGPNGERYKIFGGHDVNITESKVAKYSPTIVTTIAQLRSKSVTYDDQIFQLIGKQTPGVGSGWFYHDPNDNQSIDDGFSIVETQESKRLKRIFDSSLVSAISAGLTGNDSIEDLQKFTDFCESKGYTADFSSLAELNVKGTWYWGNLNIKLGNCVIKITSDTNFEQLGTAIRKNEGAILTKSSSMAGYGLSTVTIVFDKINILFSRPTTESTVRAAFLIEDSIILKGDHIAVVTPDGENTGKTPIDFYRGVQGVEVPYIYIYCRAGAQAGGFWIRNDSVERATKNINLGIVDIDHEAKDECLAIFNFSNAGADLNNIKIKSVISKNRGYGLGVSIMNKFAYDSNMFNDITIENIHHTMYSVGGAPFGVKTERCSPNLPNITVDIKDVSGATGQIYAVRETEPGAPESVDYLVTMGKVKVTLDTPTVPQAIFAAGGHRLVIENLQTSTLNGHFQNIVSSINAVHSGNIEGEYANMAVRNTKKVFATVHGKMEGVAHFHGTHYIDVDKKNGATWFLHSGGTALPDSTVSYTGDVIINGVSTPEDPRDVDRIVSCSASLSKDVPVICNYTVSNESDITIQNNDAFFNSFKLSEYRNLIVKSDGVESRTQALAVNQDFSHNSATQNEYEDIASDINTKNKGSKKLYYDTTHRRWLFTTHSSASSAWRSVATNEIVYLPSDQTGQDWVAGSDLSPKNNTMTLMRFPINWRQWRSQHEEALQRRANHQGNQAA